MGKGDRKRKGVKRSVRLKTSLVSFGGYGTYGRAGFPRVPISAHVIDTITSNADSERVRLYIWKRVVITSKCSPERIHLNSFMGLDNYYLPAENTGSILYTLLRIDRFQVNEKML